MAIDEPKLNAVAGFEGVSVAIWVMLCQPPAGFTYTATKDPPGLTATVFPLMATARPLSQQPRVLVRVASCTHELPAGGGLDNFALCGSAAVAHKDKSKRERKVV
jgi:hypothetical protein